jgi:hypothetical protein
MNTKNRPPDSSASTILSAEDLIRFYNRYAVEAESKEFAVKFWKLFVKKLGERKAKEIMRELMGDKAPGPRRSHEDKALINLIRNCIRDGGPNQSDKKIAKRILESKLELDVVIFEGAEHQNKRTRIGKGLPALEKQVERIRREMIEECSLPKEYAPRPYHRD